jgi:hypothetical protein
MAQNPRSCLREASLWYPEVPAINLHFNGESFTGQDPFSVGYHPLAWVRFGGSAGKNLAHIRGVLVRFSHRRLQGVRFFYDKRCGHMPATELGHFLNEFVRLTNNIPADDSLFQIDGAGGERIQAMSVGILHYQDVDDTTAEFFRHGVIKCIKVT